MIAELQGDLTDSIDGKVSICQYEQNALDCFLFVRGENAEVEGKDLISLDTADVHTADRNALEIQENVLQSMFTSNQEPEEDSPKGRRWGSGSLPITETSSVNCSQLTTILLIYQYQPSVLFFYLAL